MEAPPVKSLIFVGTLLGVFGILLVTIPTGFIEATPDFKQQTTPDLFESIDTIHFANTENFTFGNIMENWGSDTFGHSMRFTANQYKHYLHNTHFWGVWDSHSMSWINTEGINRGEDAYLSEILQDWDSSMNHTEYTVKCSHFEMFAYVTYNLSAYSSLEDAWDNNQANILFAINFDQTGTSWNAWNLIAQLLFFQLPQIHWTLNAIIAIPIWICIAWLTFAFVIALIKALPLT